MSRHKQYPIRVARSARGIRAQELRVLSRRVWWSRRWTAALELMRLGPRLGRGRQYAVAGQVTSLTIEGPHVEAVVMGSRPDPYSVSLDFTALDEAASARVAARLKAQPMLLGRILTDELPMEVETFFQNEGVALFPAGELPRGPDGKRRYDVTMRCGCPDWARPCKHLAAVLLLLGEEIARHPASLLALRGLDIDTWFPAVVEGPVSPAPVSRLSLKSGLTRDPAPLLTRLGAVPFWRGTERCVESLRRMYTRAQPIARAAAEIHSIDLRDGRKGRKV